MKNYIDKCVQTMIAEYTNNPKRIRSDYNREKEAIEVYKGRELLELIQNADDELLDGMGKEVKLSFIDGILTVSNNGSPFSKEGIDSLMYSNISSKTHKKDVIGNKGTGFRAILGWADQIRVKSGELNIRFSESYAQNVLRNIIEHSGHSISEHQYRSATLVFPEWIDTEADGEYTTDVSIYVHKDKDIVNDINKQLDDIDGELLLFLNRAEELTVETRERKVSFKKLCIDESQIIIEKYTNGTLQDRQEWLLNRQNGEFEGKHFSIVIAYNLQGLKQKRQVIYSYFPTDVEFPFPVLLHANFNLNSDRNHLTKANKANQNILGHACELLIDTALKLTKADISYEALMVLAPQKQISKELSDYGFDKVLLEKICRSKVFPTVNGQYISFDEFPKFYTSNLSRYLKGEGFDDLLIHSDNNDIRNIIRQLNKGGYPAYPFEDIVRKINKWAKANSPDKSSMEKHAHCALEFLEEYFRDVNSQKKMPILIYDTDANLVSNETSLFLSDRNANINTPPDFAQIRFIHPEMRNIFEELTKVSGRNLAMKLGSFGVKEYNTARIIEKMNSVIKRKIDSEKHNEAKQCCMREMEWIWENRQILENVGEKVRVYFFTRKGDIKMSDDLYTGHEYGNFICENILGGWSEEKFIDDIRKYIENEEWSMQEITNFLQTLGVDFFPKKRIKNIHPDIRYKTKLLDGLYFPFTFEDTTFKELRNMVSRVSHITADVLVIEELENILEKCDTQHIIEWIKADSALSQILFSRQEMNSSRVNIIWDCKQTYRRLPMDKIYAYIYWAFESIPWINVEGKRYRMSECLLSKIGTMLEPILVEPDVDGYIKEIEGNKSRIRNEYEYILGKLGVESDFADLPIEKIYSVFNILPQIAEGEVLAKRFYSALVKSDRTICDDELKCQPFGQFMESGMVLCNTGYKKNKESWYLDGKSICEKIANTYNLIEIPKRQNSAKVKRLLGVEKLSIKGEVVGNPEIHPENAAFQRDFRTYKPVAFCYRIDNATKDETKRFSELDIVLCTDLNAKYADKVIALDDYDYILKDNKTFYLKVPKSLNRLDEMKHNVTFAAAIANVLCSYIDVSTNFAAFRELYGASDFSRKELIQQIFEDDEVCERAKNELNYSENTKEEFIRIAAKCSGKNPAEVAELAQDIEFDNFSAMSNAKEVINAFKKMRIDIDQYNAESPATQIELHDYFKLELSKLLPKYETLYKLKHFYRLKGKSIEEKKRLVELFLAYESIQPKIINSVNYDCEKELVACLGLSKDIEVVDLVSIYNTNCSTWKTTWEINSEDGEIFDDEFLNDPSNMSCVYYAEYAELNKSYQDFLFSRKSKEHELEDTADVEPEVHHPQTVPAPQNVTTNSNKGSKKTGFTHKKNIEQIGLRGEKLVFDILKKQNPSVKWVSENAKIANVNPEGRAGLGYDIEFVEVSGTRVFIEVKTSTTSEIAFFMSDNEFDFAISHISEYRIYYVSEVFSKKPKILILDNVFKGNDFNTENYALDTRKEYKITATIKCVG